MSHTKDLKSHLAHDKEFNQNINSYNETVAIIKKYDAEKHFENLGFGLALQLSKNLPETHIDIGSGNGWLLQKMSPFFKKVIGIEPSTTACTLSLKINSENKNVSVINKDMIDGLNELVQTEPVFVTTSTVLNHIEDYYVAEFLQKINTLPYGSILYFDERYDKNMNWSMWHVRNKNWWIKNMPAWQLLFLNIYASKYPSGIYGIKNEAQTLIAPYTNTTTENILWYTYGVMFKTQRILHKLYRVLLHKK